MHTLASLYHDQGRYPEAKPLFLQALAIYQKALGPDHSYTKVARANYNQLREKK